MRIKESEDGAFIASLVKGEIDQINTNVLNMIRNADLEVAELTESQITNQVQNFVKVMKKLDTQSHLKYLINKFNQIDPKALQLEPERYGKLLDEITLPSEPTQNSNPKEHLELIKRLQIEKAERVKAYEKQHEQYLIKMQEAAQKARLIAEE